MAEALDSPHTTSNALERITGRTFVKTQSYVNGAWVGAVGDATLPVYDPATNTYLADVASLDHVETLRTIDATNTAQSAWRGLTGRERTGLIRRWFDLLIISADDLAALIAARQDKPLAGVKGEAIYGASSIGWFAEEAKRVSGDVMVSTWHDKRMVVLKQPVGVCTSTTPWNFPPTMIACKAAPIVTADCTIAVKPTEQMPLSTLTMIELAHRAGIPEGVVNVVTGDVDRSITIGKALCESPIVRHLSLTGSAPVGRILVQQCSPTVKKVVPKLGGHTSFIVFDDADIDAAIEGAVQSKYRNVGQTCVCMNRFYIRASIYDTFVKKLSTKVRNIKVGNGFELGVVQGLLIDDQAVEKVQRHIDDTTQGNVRLIAGDELIQGFGSQRFVEPTMLADATPDMLIAREETFGPVSAIFKFQDEAEVVRLANDTKFDLASYFFSHDIGRAWRMAEQLEYDMVDISTELISSEVAPSGGIKQSGLDREDSVYGIDKYLELKYLCMGGI